eukprot:790285_1
MIAILSNSASIITNSDADESTGTFKEEDEGDPNTSSLEWAASSAMSIFSASLYMNDYDARKHIIGCENSGRDLDFNSSWDNLASYMINVQILIDQRETEDAHGNEETVGNADDDDLSIASIEQDQAPIMTKGARKTRMVMKRLWAMLMTTI